MEKGKSLYIGASNEMGRQSQAIGKDCDGKENTAAKAALKIDYTKLFSYSLTKV